jgi:hypothetical protein
MYLAVHQADIRRITMTDTGINPIISQKVGDLPPPADFAVTVEVAFERDVSLSVD